MNAANGWPTGTTTRHGTHAGWARHKRLREAPCDACYRAKQKYDKSWRGLPARAARARIHAKAQNLAYRELAYRHPGIYQRLYSQFKEALMQEYESGGQP